ncbi:endonuclease/exonuclease/phosphatase family protein [Microlunatus ginsengisoli]|uniref:Endonuclease/exonuclease/phosphatase domain-containing protein n=1 Tax=Microlunatus ginsengisoli TaxID=363863 RepID=A0ABP6ZPJ1_9ACTN
MSTTTRQRSAQAWDNSRPGPRRGVTPLVVLAVLFALPGLLAVLLRIFPPTDDLPALVASFISYGVIAWTVALIGFGLAALLARRKAVLVTLALVCAGLLALQLSWLVPLFVPDQRPATTRTFTLLSLNIRGDLGDPDAILAESGRADVVVLLETTPKAVRDLKAAGMYEQFPYRAGTKSRGSASAIFSRFPLSSVQPLPQTSFQMWQAVAEIPGVGSVRVIAAHPCNPFCGPGYWQSEHELLQRVVGDDLDRPLVVAGDFNAVDDHLPMRDLHRMGLRSATDIVGAGWLPTYPANSRIPPLIPIDHIMLNDAMTATSITRVHVAGTDHLGLLATLAGTGG